MLSPPDIGLYTIGLTGCTAVVSHPAAPDHAARLAEVGAFYASQSPTERRALLDRERVTQVVLPGGADAAAWLGPDAPFARVPVPGAGGAIAVYERTRDGSLSAGGAAAR